MSFIEFIEIMTLLVTVFAGVGAMVYFGAKGEGRKEAKNKVAFEGIEVMELVEKATQWSQIYKHRCAISIYIDENLPLAYGFNNLRVEVVPFGEVPQGNIDVRRPHKKMLLDDLNRMNSKKFYNAHAVMADAKKQDGNFLRVVE